MKAVNDHMEHSLAELLDEIKRAEIMPTADEEPDILPETTDSSNSDDRVRLKFFYISSKDCFRISKKLNLLRLIFNRFRVII